MKLKLITTIDEVIHCRQTWDGVAGSRTFCRWDWLAQWLLSEVEDVTPAILVGMDDDDEWVGIAPFCVDETTPLFRKLRFIGSGHICTDYMGLIAKPGFEEEFTYSVADWMTVQLQPNGPLGRIDVVDLEGVWLEDERSKRLYDLLEASGFKSHTVELEGCWALDLPESWDALNKSLSKSLRRKTKKAVKRLGDEATEVLSSDNVDLEILWPIFVNLHQRRRQMLGQPGCFANPSIETFLKAAVTELSKDGKCELVIVQHDNQPLAAYLMFMDNNTAYMYQSGMDPDRVSLEPGYQVVVAALQRAIEKGYQRFDFMRGDEPYKARWKTERLPLVRMRFIPRNFSSQFKHGLWSTGRSIRQYLKHNLPTNSPQ